MTACKGGLPVRIKDIQPRGINHALKYSWDLLNKQVRQRRLRPVERDRQMALISGTTDYQGFAHRDVVIEAVFEDRLSNSGWSAKWNNTAGRRPSLRRIPHRCQSAILPLTPAARGR